MTEGITRIQQWMEEQCVDGVLITSDANRYYLSGFTGSAASLLFTKTNQYILSDFRYQEQIAEESPDFMFLKIDQKNTLTHHLSKLGLRNLGVEEGKFTYGQFLDFQKHLSPIKLLSMDGLVEKIRSVKTKEEIDSLRKAAALTDLGWNYIKEQICPGKQEKELALNLEFYMRNQGADHISFPIIAASGLRSALPHGIASDKIIEMGDFLTMDFGCRVNRYCSDMTRSLMVGKATDLQKRVYQTVLEAQQRALEAVKPGITGAELDHIAREIIENAGYGDAFGHGLGHGVGLEVHEQPLINYKGTDPIQAGMVITIEPGIYLPDLGGVRIEDLVLVTKDGYEVLSNASKELEVLI